MKHDPTAAPLLVLALFRLVLAVAGTAAALALGVDARVALVTAAVAAAFCTFLVTASRQGRARPSATAPTASALRLAVRATYPSTIGLTALTVLSLAIKPQLAAFTAGILAGLAVLALAAAAQVEWWRRA